jgi:hypothetical protein
MSARLLLAALLANAPAPAALPESYPGAKLTQIGNVLEVGGQSFRVAYFLTDDAPAQVAKHFSAAWRAQGLPVTQDGDFENEGVVSAFFTREGIQRSAIIRKHGARALVFLSVTDLWGAKDSKRQRRTIAMEGTLAQAELSSRGDASGVRQHSLLVEGSPVQAGARLETALRAEGYRLDEKAAFDRRLAFTRPRERLVASLRSAGTGLTAIYVTIEPRSETEASP